MSNSLYWTKSKKHNYRSHVMMNSQFNEQMQSEKFYRSSGNSKKKQKRKSWLKNEFITLAHHISSVWSLRSLCIGISHSLDPWASIIHLMSSFPKESYPTHLSFLKSKFPWEALSPLTQFIMAACPHHSSWQGTHIHYPNAILLLLLILLLSSTTSPHN